jgi:hypothetical protein
MLCACVWIAASFCCTAAGVIEKCLQEVENRAAVCRWESVMLQMRGPDCGVHDCVSYAYKSVGLSGSICAVGQFWQICTHCGLRLWVSGTLHNALLWLRHCRRRESCEHHTGKCAHAFVCMYIKFISHLWSGAIHLTLTGKCEIVPLNLDRYFHLCHPCVLAPGAELR